MCKGFLCLGSVALMVGLVGSAGAFTITGTDYLDPVDVTASTQFYNIQGLYIFPGVAPYNRIDPIGGGHGDNPNAGGMWMSNNVDYIAETVTVEFDFGAEFDLLETRIWNWNEAVTIGRGADSFDIYVAGADNIYGASPALSISSLPLGPGVGGIDGLPAEGGVDFSLTFPLLENGVQYVKLVNFTTATPQYAVGLSEMHFREVPEPATLALIGIGALTFIRRRRARSAADQA